MPIGESKVPTMVYSPHVLAEDRRYLSLEEGCTIREVLVRAGVPERNLRILVNTKVLPESSWGTYRVGREDIVVVQGLPGAYIVGLILTIVSLIITIVQLALAAAAKNKGGSEEAEATFVLKGARNEARFFEPVPDIFGRMRVYPPLAAAPYQEAVGGKHYQRLLLAVGYGELEISDIKIGETPIDSFEDVEYQVRPGLPTDPALSIYTREVRQESVDVVFPIRHANDNPRSDWIERTTLINTVEIGLDFDLPVGCAAFGNSGGKRPYIFRLQIEFRPVESSDWQKLTQVSGTSSIPAIIDADGIYFSAHTLKGGLVGINFRPTGSASDQYVVRVRRHDLEESKFRLGSGSISSVQADVFWLNLKTYLPEDQELVPPGIATIALRIRGTEQISGIVDTVNCIAERKLPTWTSVGGWSDTPVVSGSYTKTRNPAWAFAHILRGPANARPLEDDRLEMPAISAWADWCEVNDRKFDMVFDFKSSVPEALRVSAEAGQATFLLKETKFSVLQDIPRAVITQHITPRNSFNFEGSRIYDDGLPHGLRIRFLNEDQNYQQDERIVYADGFNEGNAELFEQLDIAGVTDPDQIYKMGRYRLAVRKLRPERYELNMDIENLVAGRGDLVRVTHDVPKFGLAAGRIKDVQLGGGGVANGITIDEHVTMASGESYSARIRKNDGSSLINSLITTAGTTNSLQFAIPIEAVDIPAKGDLVQFGYLNEESVEMLIEEIAYDEELGARVTLVDYSPAVYTAASGTIPPFDSHISIPTIPVNAPPGDPILQSVRSSVRGFNADGSLDTYIEISVIPGSGTVPTANFHAQWRVLDSISGTLLPMTDWDSVPLVPADQTEILIPIETEVGYQVRVRAIAFTGVSSNWVSAANGQVLGEADPPTNLRAEQDYALSTLGTQPVLKLIWDPPGVNAAVGYVVRWQIDGGRFTEGQTYLTEFPIVGAVPGAYSVEVFSISLTGERSEALSGEIDYVPESPIATYRVTGLELEGQGNDPEFGGRDIKLQWRYATNLLSDPFEGGPWSQGGDAGQQDPYFDSYKVVVKDPDSDEVLRTEYSIDPKFRYSYEENVEDGGPRRRVRFEVAMRDTNNNLTPASVLTVNNDAPVTVQNLQALASFKQLFISYTRPTDDLDFAGVVVWLSTSQGFTPGPDFEVARGTDNPLTLSVEPGTSYYLRLAAFDVFGSDPDELNISAEQVIQTPILVGEDLVGTAQGGTNQVRNSSFSLDTQWELSGQGTATISGGFLHLNRAGTSLPQAHARQTFPQINGYISDGTIYALGFEVAVTGGLTPSLTVSGIEDVFLTFSGAGGPEGEYIKQVQAPSGTLGYNPVRFSTEFNSEEVPADATLTISTASRNPVRVDRVLLAKRIELDSTSDYQASAYDVQNGLADSSTQVSISDGAIITPKLAALAVTAAKIAARTITADKLAVGTITANEIAAGTITASQIAAETITANQLAVGEFLSAHSASGSPAQALGETYEEVTGARVTVSNCSANRTVLFLLGIVDGAATLFGQPSSVEDLFRVKLQRGDGANPDGWVDIYESGVTNVPTSGSSVGHSVSEAFDVPSDGTFTFRFLARFYDRVTGSDSLTVTRFKLIIQKFIS